MRRLEGLLAYAERTHDKPGMARISADLRWRPRSAVTVVADDVASRPCLGPRWRMLVDGIRRTVTGKRFGYERGGFRGRLSVGVDRRMG